MSVAVIALSSTFGNHPVPVASSTPGSPIDGIRCEKEMVQTHFHAHLALLRDGNEVAVPAGIGINQEEQCLYWLHTHQTDGIIHIESPGPSKFTLGQFFDIWGQPLSSTRAGPLSALPGEQLHIYVDGSSFSGNPRTIDLQPHQLLVIEAGQEVPPPTYSFPAGY